MFPSFVNSSFSGNIGNSGNFNNPPTSAFEFGQSQQNVSHFQSAFSNFNKNSNNQNTRINNGNFSAFTNNSNNSNFKSENNSDSHVTGSKFNNGNLRGGSQRGRGSGRNRDNFGNGQTRNSSTFSGPSKNSINYFQNNSSLALPQPPNLPTSSGFRQRLRSSLPTPPYLQVDQKLITNISSQPDPWDVQNQQKMLSLEISQTDDSQLENIYRKLQAMREVERREMENRGLVDQQDTRKDLKDAIIFVGSCQDKCPTFERVRRAYEKDTKPFEKVRIPIAGSPLLGNTNQKILGRQWKRVSRPICQSFFETSSWTAATITF